ncbi:hypothetical protein M8C17_21100 [Micromonospora sp. RHAY321]|uniref:hypothetical protein n=1 Tax=Micromonospora sp. RHAY321 TaxID=2944807 RepID=UPI00207CA44C|nr:hypothetical protein [Micromonospora sp. RHAY321]MCO1597653.1 hypothetical protein [Micromonospora sp. RHAY321]
MTPDPARLELTEDALAQLITTYAQHHAAAAGQDRRRQRHRTTTGPMGDAASVERTACWLRMVSIVEIYVEALLKQLDGERTGRAARGWADVAAALKQRHDIDLHAIASWDKLDACFLVRNAVAHGLGRFTAKQIETAVPRKIRILGVPVRDGMVVITAESLDGCSRVCQHFVADLDGHPRAVIQSHPR